MTNDAVHPRDHSVSLSPSKFDKRSIGRTEDALTHGLGCRMIILASPIPPCARRPASHRPGTLVVQIPVRFDFLQLTVVTSGTRRNPRRRQPRVQTRSAHFPTLVVYS